MMNRIHYFLTFYILIFFHMFATENASKVPYHLYERLIKPIVKRMTLEEKLGQMTVVPFMTLQNRAHQIDVDLIQVYHLGAILAAGTEIPNGIGGIQDGLNPVLLNEDYSKEGLTATAQHWMALNQQLNTHPVLTAKGDQIPLLIGVDAVHGHQKVLGNTLFPHNIGLSMTHNPSLLFEIGYWTAHDALSTGFNWVYAPTIAISHHPGWGRTYESLGSVTHLVKKYAASLIDGFQQIKDGKITGVLATAKHYLGDGATYLGIDEGNVIVKDFDRFLKVNGSGYQAAILHNVGSIMISYHAVNDVPMSLNSHFIHHSLRQNEGNYFGKRFRGFIVSDYGVVEKIMTQGPPTTSLPAPISYGQALAQVVNSGIDLIMLSSTGRYEKDLNTYFATFKELVESGTIAEARIDEAVTHILTIKYAMGLIQLNKEGEAKQASRPAFPEYSQSHSKKSNRVQQSKIYIATQAAEQSLILLKNDKHLLPLKEQTIKYLILVGHSLIPVRDPAGNEVATLFANYDNIGIQSGGWTITWQGIEGNHFWHGVNKQSAGATSLLDGLKNIVPYAKVITSSAELAAHSDIHAENSVIIGVLAEPPYAEFMGDIANPSCIDCTHSEQGCLYHLHLNPYLPSCQKQNLEIDYESFDQEMIDAVKKISQDIPLITVLFSGRPMIIQKPLGKSDAFIAAWLPGTSGGQAIANGLFGRFLFGKGKHQNNNDLCRLNSPNTLTINWVRNMEQLENYPIYRKGKGPVSFKNPLFKIGYGLATTFD